MHCEHGNFLLCFIYSAKGNDFSDQSRFLLQLSGISEIAKGIEGDRQDDIQTNEENKSSTQIMFAGDFHEMQNKSYERENFHFCHILFLFCVFVTLIVFHSISAVSSLSSLSRASTPVCLFSSP